MKKRSAINIIILILVLAAIAAVVYELIPKFPTPSYEVSDYDTMAKAFSVESQIAFPAKEDLPNYGLNYTVYLIDRFHYTKSGYLISGQDGETRFEISCKDVSTLSEEEIKELNDHSGEVDYHGVAMKSMANSNGTWQTFIINNHRYILSMQNGNENLAAKLEKLAKGIIDQ